MSTVTIKRAKLEQWVKAVVSVARYAPAGEGVFSAVMMAQDDMNEVLKQARSAPLQEPVAVIGSDFQLLYCREDWAKGLKVGDALCLCTPAAAPVPLTDEQIDTAWLLNGGGLAANRYYDFARAIEAARGIKKGGTA
jgi:hypothetical protein